MDGADTFKTAVWTLRRAVVPSVDGERLFMHTPRNVASLSLKTACTVRALLLVTRGMLKCLRDEMK